MNRSRHTSRYPSRTTTLLLGYALLAACVLVASPGQATSCLRNADPVIGRLQELVGENAAKALRETQTRIDALEHAPRSNPELNAALYAVQAQSYSALELDSDARNAALQGLRLAPNAKDPTHLDLLSAYAENVYDEAGINSAVEEIEKTRALQAAGSLADTCLLITLGRLQYRQNRGDLAILSLTKAYRASAPPQFAEQRVRAAAALSSVMRGMGDYTQALVLNQEVIDWDISHGASLDLSVSRFLRGAIHMTMRDYPAATDQFTQARKLSVELGDQQGIAFADLSLCEAKIELGQLVPAEQQCRSALQVFTAAQSTDVVKEARAALANIDLENGHADRALSTLNEVLDHGGADVPPRRIPSLYKLRARANAALHNYRDAYTDLNEYLQRNLAVSEAERVRQAAALRTRFETDREIDRNASLQHELTLAQELSGHQKEQLRWTAIAAAAAVLVIVLLTYILNTNLRHRRQLQRLASQDSLTGLPNRRRTTELANAAITAAISAQQPLTVAIIDLDHFKAINDRYGHAAGDHVLREFARMSRESLRDSDILGRWGGEEFLLVMPGTTLDAALVSLERLRTQALQIRLPSMDAELKVTLSAGLAMNEHDVKSLDDIVARADAALYDAKNQGRDLVSVADESYRTTSTGARRARR